MNGEPKARTRSRLWCQRWFRTREEAVVYSKRWAPGSRRSGTVSDLEHALGRSQLQNGERGWLLQWTFDHTAINNGDASSNLDRWDREALDRCQGPLGYRSAYGTWQGGTQHKQFLAR